MRVRQLARELLEFERRSAKPDISCCRMLQFIADQYNPSLHQKNLLPWLISFAKALEADKYVIHLEAEQAKSEASVDVYPAPQNQLDPHKINVYMQWFYDALSSEEKPYIAFHPCVALEDLQTESIFAILQGRPIQYPAEQGPVTLNYGDQVRYLYVPLVQNYPQESHPRYSLLIVETNNHVITRIHHIDSRERDHTSRLALRILQRAFPERKYGHHFCVHNQDANSNFISGHYLIQNLLLHCNERKIIDVIDTDPPMLTPERLYTLDLRVNILAPTPQVPAVAPDTSPTPAVASRLLSFMTNTVAQSHTPTTQSNKSSPFATIGL